LAASDHGEREGLFTGYYEPLLMGSRQPDKRFHIPLHRRPDDLIQVDLGRFDSDLEGRRITGRVIDQRLLPYPTRAEIDAGALDGKSLEMLWVDDDVAKFFLQIQGSGQVQLPDGSRIRVGYADQNGQPYRAIGRDLLDMGALAKGTVSLQSIRAWLEQHPDQAQTVMEKNRSYVFFRELPDVPGAEGPPGAQGVPLTPGRSLAVDRRFLPLGVPIWLETSAPSPNGPKPLDRLVVAQDTGGAIRGPIRGDLFWGTGSDAEYGAVHMQSRGRYYLLVPRALAPAS
jgi:membrane-bound lytic murein transglycosylase A